MKSCANRRFFLYKVEHLAKIVNEFQFNYFCQTPHLDVWQGLNISLSSSTHQVSKVYELQDLETN